MARTSILARRSLVPRSSPIDCVWMLVKTDESGIKSVMYHAPATNLKACWDNAVAFWAGACDPARMMKEKVALAAGGWKAKRVVIGEAY